MVENGGLDRDKISTHTLTWSVTTMGSACVAEFFNFNSHAHVERDPLLPLPQCLSFQISTHTLTWSVTQSKFYDSKVTYDFNSHAHVERDEQNCNYLPWQCHFNSHAHVERDT